MTISHANWSIKITTKNDGAKPILIGFDSDGVEYSHSDCIKEILEAIDKNYTITNL